MTPGRSGIRLLRPNPPPRSRQPPRRPAGDARAYVTVLGILLLCTRPKSFLSLYLCSSSSCSFFFCLFLHSQLHSRVKCVQTEWARLRAGRRRGLMTSELLLEWDDEMLSPNSGIHCSYYRKPGAKKILIVSPGCKKLFLFKFLLFESLFIDLWSTFFNCS